MSLCLYVSMSLRPLFLGFEVVFNFCFIRQKGKFAGPSRLRLLRGLRLGSSRDRANPHQS